jgi:formylglycine-generating enzyme required for sulfatase activity
MELVLVPAGSFMMGSEKSDDEKPAHRVSISQPFYMGKYEVTQAQWQSVPGPKLNELKLKRAQLLVKFTEEAPEVKAIDQRIAELRNPSHFKDCGSNCPVETVSWDEAQEFIKALNDSKDGFTYRLPTEAEWEYACRAGTTGDYAGDLDVMAWYGNNSGRGRLDAAEIYRSGSDYYKRIIENGGQTHAVGSKLPNAFGLFDMHGNVWEWCQDWYHNSYSGAPTDGSAWLGDGEQKYRMLRGGSWYEVATATRSANRSWGSPDFRGNNYGFRVVAVR